MEPTSMDATSFEGPNKASRARAKRRAAAQARTRPRWCSGPCHGGHRRRSSGQTAPKPPGRRHGHRARPPLHHPARVERTNGLGMEVDLNDAYTAGDSPQFVRQRQATPPAGWGEARNLFGQMPGRTEEFGDDDIMEIINEGHSTQSYEFEDQNSPMFEPIKKPFKRGSAYTVKEDELLVTAWLEVSHDPICGAEQKGSTYWKKIHDFLHDMKNYPPHNFTSDRNENSLAHRWATIQDTCNKICGAYEQVKNKNPSGMGIESHMNLVATLYKNSEGKTFGLTHCWIKMNKASKWQELVASLKNPNVESKKQKNNDGSSSQSNQLDEDGEASGGGLAPASCTARPRGRKWEQERAKRAPSASSLKNSWAEIISNKEVSSAKREKKKEERCKGFMEMQAKKVELDKERMAIEREKATIERERGRSLRRRGWSLMQRERQPRPSKLGSQGSPRSRGYVR